MSSKACFSSWTTTTLTMPELRSGARRNRAPNNPDPNPIIQPDANGNKLTVRTRQRRGTGQNRRDNSNSNNNKKGNDAIEGVDERNIVKARRGGKVIETKSFKDKEKQEEEMDEYDSGGRSGDKGPAADDEGSTAPLPEKVSLSLFYNFFLVYFYLIILFKLIV